MNNQSHKYSIHLQKILLLQLCYQLYNIKQNLYCLILSNTKMDFQNESDLQIEKILDKKVFNGKTLYLVKWKNYPIQQATWECNKLLINVKDKIRQFKHSKRASEQILNIKFEEDFLDVQVRDTFKRKRGRPPRMSFNSYREAANQITQKNSEFNKTTENFIKRGRGRPRGSKNKRSRHAHFEAQSEVTFQSDQFEKSQNQQRTLTNEDSSNNQENNKESKKQEKLKKIALKAIQNLKNQKIKDEFEEQFDIVDSQDQIQRDKMNLDEQPEYSTDVIANSYENTIQSISAKKFTEKSPLLSKKQKQISKDQKIVLEDGQLIPNEMLKHENKKVIQPSESKSKLKKNIETMSSQKEFERIFNKQTDQNLKDFNKQLVEFQQKYFKEQKKHLEKLKEKQVVNSNSAQVKQFFPKNFIKNHQRITKIYHLQTIELNLSKDKDSEQFNNEQFGQQSNGSFSQKLLKRMSVTRQIVQIFSDSLNMKRVLPLSKQNGQKQLISKSRLIYDNLFYILKHNPTEDNQEIIEHLIQQSVHQKGNIQGKVYQALYLVEFNQGKTIKKMTASEVHLYLIIDMIRTFDMSRLDQCYESLINVTFYFKYLEKSIMPVLSKNQSKQKLQKSTVRNTKFQEKNINSKQQIQNLLIQALKNVQTKPNVNRSNRFKHTKKIHYKQQNDGSNLFQPQNQQSKDLLLNNKNSVNTPKIEEEQLK